MTVAKVALHMTGSFATNLAPTDVNLPPAISASAPVTGTQGPQSESDSSLTRMFYWSHSTDFSGAATDFQSLLSQ